MSGGIQRWGLLAGAVALVAVALWLLQRPSGGRGPGDEPSVTRSGSPGAEAGAGRSAGGIAPRETSVPGHGWIRGQVVDPDGTPLTEGQVVLWCRSDDGSVDRVRGGVLTLDEDGRFAGPGCRGLVCPRLQHPWAVPAEPWSLRSGAEVVLEVRRLPRLWGRVVDPTGAPVAAARIVVSAPPGADDPQAVLPVVSPQTSTDVDGEFSLALVERPPCDPCQEAQDACPDGVLPLVDPVLVSARAPGWAPGARLVALDEVTEADDPLEVALQPARAAISGHLVDAAGQPLPRAVVLARSEVHPSEQHQADASDGSFALDGLGEGPFTVRAIGDGRELVRRPGVEPGATLELRLDHRARDLTIELVDEAGRPWPQVQVDGGPFERERSDAQGLLRAQRVLPGSYILRVRPPGARARAVDLAVPPAPAASAGARNPSPLRIELASGG